MGKNEGVLASLLASQYDILVQLLHGNFDFCPNTLMPIRWLTSPGFYAQNSSSERQPYIAINGDAWKGRQ